MISSTAEALSCWPFTIQVQVQCQASPGEIHVGQSGSGALPSVIPTVFQAPTANTI